MFRLSRPHVDRWTRGSYTIAEVRANRNGSVLEFMRLGSSKSGSKVRTDRQKLSEHNRTECCQSLLPMPEAEVLADVKGPRVSPDSVLAGMGINGPGSQALEFWSRRTSRFTSIARTINHFESAESRSEVQPIVLLRWIVCRGLTRTAVLLDHTRSRRSEQIGMNRFRKSCGRVRASQ